VERKLNYNCQMCGLPSVSLYWNGFKWVCAKCHYTPVKCQLCGKENQIKNKNYVCSH
jgi:ribosomal protein S27AE